MTYQRMQSQSVNLISSLVLLMVLSCNDSDMGGEQRTTERSKQISNSEDGVISSAVAPDDLQRVRVQLNDDSQTHIMMQKKYEYRAEDEKPNDELVSLTEEFRQGKMVDIKETAAGEVRSAPLDILITVDTSGSMGNDQEMVGNFLPLLLTALDGVDWRIGINTTDPRGWDRTLNNPRMDECAHVIFDSKENDPKDQTFIDTFKSNVLKTNGTGHEQAFRMAGEAIIGDCQVASTRFLGENHWIRPDSFLAIFIVSDEYNCSNEHAYRDGDRDLCGETPPAAGNEYYEYAGFMEFLKNIPRTYTKDGLDNDTVRVFSLLDARIKNNPDYQKAFQNASLETDGLFFALDSNDEAAFKAFVENELTQNIKAALRQSLALKKVPVNNTVSVKVIQPDMTERVLSPAGFTYDKATNSVVFDPAATGNDAAPTSEDQVEISFKWIETPVFSDVQLKQTPLSTPRVTSSVGADLPTWVWDGANKIVFDSLPPNNAQIVVDYDYDSISEYTINLNKAAILANTPYANDIDSVMLSDLVIPGSIEVTDGSSVVDSAAYQVDLENERITFLSQIPKPGAQIVLTMKLIIENVLVYDSSLTALGKENLIAIDAKSKAPVVFDIDSKAKTIQFAEGEFADGREVLVKAKYDKKSILEEGVALPEEADDSSIGISFGSDEVITCPRTTLKVKDGMVLLSEQCEIPKEAEVLNIYYKVSGNY